jgi:hypothetical protein
MAPRTSHLAPCTLSDTARQELVVLEPLAPSPNHRADTDSISQYVTQGKSGFPILSAIFCRLWGHGLIRCDTLANALASIS